jgi:hypothetical protein
VRDLTPYILDRNASRVAVTQIAVDITIAGAGTIRLGTGGFHVKGVVLNAAISAVSRNYVAGIKAAPSASLAKGKAPDGGQFTIQNFDLVMGQLVGDPSVVLDGSPIQLFQCWLSEDGVNYYADQVIEGTIRDAQATAPDCVVTIVSDMSARRASVAARPLSQRCVAEFGGHGCWFPKEPGQTCSHVYDDKVAGCAFYGWQSQVWGVPFLSIVDPVVNPDGFDPDIDRFQNGGWSRGGRPNPWDPGWTPFNQP